MNDKKDKMQNSRRSPRRASVATPTTLPPKIKSRMHLLIDLSDLSVREIYSRLDLDDLGVVFGTFRGYVHKRRKSNGQNLGRWRANFSKSRANAIAEIIFFASCKAFSRRFVDAMIDRMIQLKDVADLGKPKCSP